MNYYDEWRKLPDEMKVEVTPRDFARTLDDTLTILQPCSVMHPLTYAENEGHVEGCIGYIPAEDK